MRHLYIIVLLLLISARAFATEPGPLSGGLAQSVASGSLGTTAVIILNRDTLRKFLQVQNITLGSNVLACTVDGTAPVVGGNGFQLAGTSSGAGGSATFDAYVPFGQLTCIGSTSGTAYWVNYTP